MGIRSQPTTRSALVLVVDPCDQNRNMITDALSAPAFHCIEAKDGITAWTHFLDQHPDALLAAADLPGLQPSELLARVRAHSTVPFMLHSTTNDAQIAVSAMRAGADDFFVLPKETSNIASRLSVLLGHDQQRSSQDALQSLIVGQSRSIARVRDKLLAVTGLRIPVLVRGETGSGLDHTINTIARLDKRHDNALIVIRPGSMRPPIKSDAGRTVYIDRVESLLISDQGQWLRQIARCERGEADAPHRVLASTTSDLAVLATQNTFDLSLAQRLNQFSIEIPPLRDRAEDIGPLARHLASKIAREMGRPRVVVTATAVRLLQEQVWQHNVRELNAILEKLVAFSVDGIITRKCVQQVLSEAPSGVNLMRVLEERRRRDELVATLDATGGNLAEAARRLSMSRGAVIYRAQKFGLLARRA